MTSILSHLAQQITKEIALADKAYGKSVDHAIRAGGLLRRAKAQLRHGEWTGWLQKNCSLSARQARRYMAIHQACGESDTRDRYPSMQAVLDAVFRSNHQEWFGAEAEETTRKTITAKRRGSPGVDPDRNLNPEPEPEPDSTTTNNTGTNRGRAQGLTVATADNPNGPRQVRTIFI